MNKKYNYKIGDKVILLIYSYGYKGNDIGKIIGYNNGAYIIDSGASINNKIDHMLVEDKDIKYYYEKPLQDLLNKINVYWIGIKEDHIKIKSFIDSNETLTDEELLICQNIWEKYNKK